MSELKTTWSFEYNLGDGWIDVKTDYPTEEAAKISAERLVYRRRREVRVYRYERLLVDEYVIEEE